jgi:hypothetical protein
MSSVGPLDDPLDALELRALLVVEAWGTEGFDVVIINDGPPRPARLDELRGAVVAIGLEDRRAVEAVMRQRRKGDY